VLAQDVALLVLERGFEGDEQVFEHGELACHDAEQVEKGLLVVGGGIESSE